MWASTALVTGQCNSSSQFSRELLLRKTDFGVYWRRLQQGVGASAAEYRGGHFLFKPYIILRALEASPPDGWVVYSDVLRRSYLHGGRAGFTQSVRPLISWLAANADENPLGVLGVFLDLPNRFHQRWFPEVRPVDNLLPDLSPA